MKLTKEELLKRGVYEEAYQEEILEEIAAQAQAREETIAALEEEVRRLRAESRQAEKTAAVKEEILKAGGRNCKAILALIDMEGVRYDKNGLQGLDLEAVREEAPYLFSERKEQREGTGTAASRRRKKEDEIREAFRRGMGR